MRYALTTELQRLHYKNNPVKLVFDTLWKWLKMDKLQTIYTLKITAVFSVVHVWSDRPKHKLIPVVTVPKILSGLVFFGKNWINALLGNSSEFESNKLQVPMNFWSFSQFFEWCVLCSNLYCWRKSSRLCNQLNEMCRKCAYLHNTR